MTWARDITGARARPCRTRSWMNCAGWMPFTWERWAARMSRPASLRKACCSKCGFELDQYINLRPVKLYPGVDCPLKGKGPKDIDFVVVRENTEGLYTGAGGFLKKGAPDEVAIQTSINTRKGVERCIRFAFELARKRNKQKTVTLCGKTNVLTFAWDLWERVFKPRGARIS